MKPTIRRVAKDTWLLWYTGPVVGHVYAIFCSWRDALEHLENRYRHEAVKHNA